VQEREGAVVGYEEESVQGAIAEEGCCCAYAGVVRSVCCHSTQSAPA